MTTTSRLAAGLLIVPLLFLAGCGGDDEPADDADETPSAATSESTSESPSESPSAEVDGCEFLPLTVVTEAFGEEMKVIAGPETCLFTSVAEESPSALTLNVIQILIDPEEYAEGSRDNCDTEPAEVDAGDQAWTCVTFVGPQGYVFEGGHSAVLDVVAADEDDDAAALALAEAVLPAVTLP